MNNKFIVIEGLEGATSAIVPVTDVLRHHGVSELVFTRDGTPLAEELRQQLITNKNLFDFLESLAFDAIVSAAIRDAADAMEWLNQQRLP